MLISISKDWEGEKKKRTERNKLAHSVQMKRTRKTRTQTHELHGPYENTILPKWISCNWFQIARSRGKGDTGHYYTKRREETRMFTQATLIAEQSSPERKKRDGRKKRMSTLSPLSPGSLCLDLTQG